MRQNPRTIAFFSGFSLPHVGGVETYTRRVAEELVKRGYRVIVVSARYDDGPWKEVVAGIEEIRLPVFPVARSRYPLVKPDRRFFRTMAYLRRAGIERVVVNTRFYVTSLVGAWFGRRLGVPVSLIEHGSAPLTLDSKVLDTGLDVVERVLTRLIRGSVTDVYGVSQAAAAHVQERFGITPAGVWYNSIDLDENDAEASPRPARSRLTVAYVGRVIRQKGVDTLLEAFATVQTELSDRGYDLECVIAGDGAYLPELQERYGRVPGVEFRGRISQSEVHELLARTDIFVYAPVVPEGLPSSLLEAGAAACAVVGTPQGGIVEILRNDETGLVVGSSTSELARALASLIESPERRHRLAQALHAEVLSRFTTARVVDQMERDLRLTDTAPRRQRVLHLLGTDRVSGAENVIITLMELLRDSDFEMTYCSLDGPIRDVLAARDLAFVPLPRLTPAGLRSVLATERVDVIHAHDFKASVVATLVGFRGPIVSHLHSNPGFVKSWNPLSAVFRVACRRFRRVVFVSDEATRGTVFADSIADKVRVIYNVVDRDRVTSLSMERQIPATGVLFLGRLTALKQPRVVVRAVAAASSAVPGLTARLVGDGDRRDECAREIAERGLGDRVFLEGFQDNPFPFVRAARVALMPSTYEGLGLSAIECLALGVPVLNSGAGGLGDLFASHPEFLCATVDEYAAKIVELQDPVVYQAYQDACAEIVEPYADLDRYRRQIRELYE
ncbi:glycosyltransferase [Xylanimonas allomyrinae]|uniref:glycosyltransferase n=1 Tax=Xylanimonas allomyrinae TaxID=2509459 RepID=UPI0013A60C6D|nr:glycosyltransferase [Xylanimonas allomyrinae]